MTQKRKAAEVESFSSVPPSKKRHPSPPVNIKSAFRSDLFDSSVLTSYRSAYTASGPYPHAVVRSLIEDGLLRRVRNEIIPHIHFTLKETDIYRIHQSGDLANLSGLDPESLAHLPSLVRLRDALYSDEFREWVSTVTGAGKLSGQKTDMAVNVYTPGSYLLCHDDVIGSRRVSYILYLTDPDHPWQADWGGGLRLFPTERRRNEAGEEVKVPLAEHSMNIPPSFGQLSFFAVLPGESYHDVEEVYHGSELRDGQERVRMAISGWFHIPQAGEDGYEEGLEQAQAQRSSLSQLKSAAHEFDEPQVRLRHFDEPRLVMNSSATGFEVDPGDHTDADDEILTEQDLSFLLQYIRAQFLTPDMIEQVSASFEDLSILQLDQFLCDTFAREIKAYIDQAESGSTSNEADAPARWTVARPPHKHRYAYLQDGIKLTDQSSPISKLLVDVLHSHAFKKWLALVTGLKTPSLTRQHALARRFRRGKDYALASAFTGDQPQLEFTISLTPSQGWNPGERESDQDGVKVQGARNGRPAAPGVKVETGEVEFGGEEVYMAGDDEDDDQTSLPSHFLPQVGKKTDPAVYRAAGDQEEDGILFANHPTWNQFSVVLRDKGTLRFVKYVSQAANGDRWDIKGEVELADDAFDGEDEEDEEDDLDHLDSDEQEEAAE